jgi:hypothetical protein
MACPPLEATSYIPCPAAGIVVYEKSPGERVRKGDVIAQVVHLDSENIGDRSLVRSDTEGVLIVRQAPGAWFAHQKSTRPRLKSLLLAEASRRGFHVAACRKRRFHPSMVRQFVQTDFFNRIGRIQPGAKS